MTKPFGMSPVVGNYCGRTVRIARCDDYTEKLTDAVVLLVLAEDLVATCRANVIGSVFSRYPLAIKLFGVGAEPGFDELIDCQAANPHAPHVMTGTVEANTDLVDAVEDFLAGTLPSDDRFDSWHAYEVMVVGSDEDLIEVRSAVERALTESS